MSTSSRFDTFIDNIKLTSDQISDARTKYDGVCKKLHDYFYSNFIYNGSTKLLIGSYGKGTNIRPARDVDVVFKMPWTEFSESTSFYNAQSYLLQKIKRILKEKYPDTDMRGDGQVVVVNFSSNHFVEVVPSFEFNSSNLSGKFYIPDTNNGGKWKLADPRSEIKQISDSDELTNGNTCNLIRMIKKWQSFCNVPIRSLVIELRVVNFLKKYEYASYDSIYYDWMVRDFFKELLNYVNGNCKMPGLDETIYYGDEWKSKTESAYSRAIKACEYETAKDEDGATLEWKKIFGEDFYF